MYIEKNIPYKTVKNNPWVDWELILSINLWWAHVTVVPEVNKIAVFNKKIRKGLNATILIGGYILQSSMKECSKNEKKNF